MILPLQLVGVNTFQSSFHVSLTTYVYASKIFLKAQATVNPKKFPTLSSWKKLTKKFLCFEKLIFSKERNLQIIATAAPYKELNRKSIYKNCHKVLIYF